MALGPHVPEWLQLQSRLNRLAVEARAVNACVFDAWGLPWCCGVHSRGTARDASNIVRRALRRAQPRLERGGTILEVLGADDGGAAFVQSFAGVYVVVLRYVALFDRKATTAIVTAALPELEELVLALPSPHGPGSGSAEALERG